MYYPYSLIIPDIFGVNAYDKPIFSRFHIFISFKLSVSSLVKHIQTSTVNKHYYLLFIISGNVFGFEGICIIIPPNFIFFIAWNKPLPFVGNASLRIYYPRVSAD